MVLELLAACGMIHRSEKRLLIGRLAAEDSNPAVSAPFEVTAQLSPSDLRYATAEFLALHTVCGNALGEPFGDHPTSKRKTWMPESLLRGMPVVEKEN